MNVSELRAQALEELKSTLLDLNKSQFNLRLQNGSGQLSQTHLLKQVRRDIAKVKTVIREKKVGENG